MKKCIVNSCAKGATMGTQCIEHWTRERHPDKAATLWDYRATDPATSKAGAQAVTIRKESQQAILLALS